MSGSLSSPDAHPFFSFNSRFADGDGRTGRPPPSPQPPPPACIDPTDSLSHASNLSAAPILWVQPRVVFESGRRRLPRCCLFRAAVGPYRRRRPRQPRERHLQRRRQRRRACARARVAAAVRDRAAEERGRCAEVARRGRAPSPRLSSSRPGLVCVVRARVVWMCVAMRMDRVRMWLAYFNLLVGV